jgi:hypothetical protein
MLLLPVGGRGKTASRQLPAMQAREGELKKQESQRAPKTTTGWMFSSSLTTPGVSFSSAFRGSADHQRPQAGNISTAGPPTEIHVQVYNITASATKLQSGQSVRAPIIHSQPLDNKLKVVTAVQQIMTEFNGALSEEDKRVAITKIVLILMKHNGH